LFFNLDNFRSVRFDELQVKCLVKIFGSPQEEEEDMSKQVYFSISKFLSKMSLLNTSNFVKSLLYQEDIYLRRYLIKNLKPKT